MQNRILFFLLPLTAVVLFITSCGPAAADIFPSLESAEDADHQEETAPSEAGPADTAPAAFTETAEAVYNGVPVGFTAEGRPYRGDLEAPILLEEFSDYQCPFCGRFTAQTMPQLEQNQIANGEAVLVYYDFPLESIHSQAFAAANAARCAGEQGAQAYWQMHDMLYERMGDWGVSDPDPIFTSYAEQIGLDEEAFALCQVELRYSDEIKADIDHALSRGVRSTPSFFVNDQPLIGAQPLEAFNQAIALVQSGESIAQEPPEPQAPSQQESPLQPPAVKPTPAVIATDTYAATMGDPNAPVTIVEFTDYQCPYCQSFSQETLPTLMAEKIATGEVYYILKDLPLDSIHPNARAAAKAARCAGEQDAYWEMHDALFDSQAGWGGQGELPEAIFVDLAAGLGLDGDAFATCMDEQTYMLAIQENVEEARALGADSTPFFFIDGLPIPGAQPYELFDYAVELAKEGTLADAFVPPEPSLENVNAIGDPNAPVTIIEYTDYQCPFCSRYVEQSFAQIKEKYVETGQVYYVFKDFPLTNIHPQAVQAAEATRCAAEQDAFLPMHDRLFAEQGAWSGNPDAAAQFKQYAQDLALDSAAFDECLDSGRQQTAVMADLEEGAAIGVNGTPAFIINGHAMSGAQPYPIFEQAIEQFLADAG